MKIFYKSSKKLPIRKRCQRKAREGIAIKALPLFYLMAFLCIFLLKSRQATQVVANLSKEIALSRSSSGDPEAAGVHVQVSLASVWVDHHIVVNDIRTMENGKAEFIPKMFDKDGMVVLPLFNELVNLRENHRHAMEFSGRGELFGDQVNLVLDRNLRYDFIKKILLTCSQAGFKHFNFIVQGK